MHRRRTIPSQKHFLTFDRCTRNRGSAKSQNKDLVSIDWLLYPGFLVQFKIVGLSLCHAELFSKSSRETQEKIAFRKGA